MVGQDKGVKKNSERLEQLWCLDPNETKILMKDTDESRQAQKCGRT